MRAEPDVHICAKCKKPIIGEYILLYGQRMHPEVMPSSASMEVPLTLSTVVI
jgi:hypothetical protein